MTIPYKNSDDSKKKQVATMFDNIAGSYDFLNHFLSFGIDKIWRRAAINELKKNPPKQILDIACGTGDLSLAMQKLHPERIIGADISIEMLEVGKRKIAKRGLSELIDFQIGDSENLQFDNNSFDAVTVAFGVRNFENLEKGLREMHRVLKPNGSLMILEFSKPRNKFVKWSYAFYSRYILSAIGNLISRDGAAYSYLPESIEKFPYGAALTDILRKCQFENPEFKELTFGIASIYTATKSL